ncbi:MAG: DUF3196 family protein [Erysipelotrichaceae bacterium]
MQDFYTDLLDRIDNLIGEQQYQQAEKLIDDELKMPFVPLEIEKKLIEYQRSIKGYLSQPLLQQQLSEQQLYQYLTSSSQKGFKALQYLQKSNIRNYLTFIQQLLSSDEVNHLLKCLLFEILVDQAVNCEVEFKKQDQLIQLNPIMHNKAVEQEGFDLVNQRLQQLLCGNPSFLNQCQLVLVNALYDLYPTLLLKDDVDIYCFSIIKYVCQAYGDLQKWQDFAQYYEVDESTLVDFSF